VKEFETIGEDGNVYLHYDNWVKWRTDRLNEYPCPHAQWRMDITLTFPSDKLEDVPVLRNPHTFHDKNPTFNPISSLPAGTVRTSRPSRHPNLTGHSCFYVCDDWSTIFGVHDAHIGTWKQRWQVKPDTSYRMLIESGNKVPSWGEQIRLMSTSGCIYNEPWGKNKANKFAYFRGKFWLVQHDEFLHEWGCWRDIGHTGLPISDRRQYNDDDVSYVPDVPWYFDQSCEWNNDELWDNIELPKE